ESDAGAVCCWSAGGVGSQASPTPLWSESSWPGFIPLGQLSHASTTPSPSPSALPACISWQLGGFSLPSQASPVPLPFESSCPGCTTVGQLSQPSTTPSPSESASPACASAHVGCGSQASPMPLSFESV